MQRVVYSLLSLCLAASSAWAIGPPINTDTPITLGLEGRGLRSFAKVVRVSNDRLDGKATTMLLPLAIPYNATTDAVIGVIVPTVFKEMQQGGSTISSSGLGDISLFAKYVILQVDGHQETFRLAPKVVVKLPTGDETEAPALGTGSTDVSVGGVAAWLTGRTGVYSDWLYQVTGQANSRDFGNGLTYNLALAYRLAPSVYKTYPTRQTNIFLEFNGSWKGKDRFQGRTVANSGGHVTFLAPGIQFIPLSRLLVEASLQMPVLVELGGQQMEPDWAASLGARFLLY